MVALTNMIAVAKTRFDVTTANIDIETLKIISLFCASGLLLSLVAAIYWPDAAAYLAVP